MILKINQTNTPNVGHTKLHFSKAAKSNHSEPGTLSLGFGSIATGLAIGVIRPSTTILYAKLVAALCN